MTESLFSSGETSFKINTGLDEAFSLAFSPSRPDLAIGCVKGAAVYDLETKRTRYMIKPPQDRKPSFEWSENGVSRVLLAPDGKTLATVAWDSDLWNADSGAYLGRLLAKGAAVEDLSFSPVFGLLAESASDVHVSGARRI